MIPLQMLDCTNCGKCCSTIGMPPFILPNPLIGSWHSIPVDNDWYMHELNVFLGMPREVLRAHADAVLALRDDPSESPCIWLKEGRCSQYAHRPMSCRVWQIGDKGCIAALRGATVVFDSKNPPHIFRNPRHKGRATLREFLRYAWRVVFKRGLIGISDLLETHRRRL